MSDDNQKVINRVMKSYMVACADRELLAKAVQDFEKQHNELYGLLITILRANGGQLAVDKAYWPPFPVGEYLVDWEDGGDELIVNVRHFSEND